MPIRELFDNDPSLGREVFKMSRYLSLKQMAIGSETSSLLAMVGCIAKGDAEDDSRPNSVYALGSYSVQGGGDQLVAHDFAR